MVCAGDRAGDREREHGDGAASLSFVIRSELEPPVSLAADSDMSMVRGADQLPIAEIAVRRGCRRR